MSASIGGILRSGRVEWCCALASNGRFSRSFVLSDTERMAAKRARPYRERRGGRLSDCCRTIPLLKRTTPSSSFGSGNAAGLVWSLTPLSAWKMCCVFRRKSRSATNNKCTYLQHIKNCTVVWMSLLKVFSYLFGCCCMYYSLYCLSNVGIEGVRVCAPGSNWSLHTALRSVSCPQASEYPGSTEANCSIWLHVQGTGMCHSYYVWRSF